MPNIDELTTQLEAAIKEEDLAAVERILGQLEEATKDLDSEPPLGGSGEKCDERPHAEGMPSRPYQGAKTFAEADALIVYNRDEGKVSEQIGMFHALESNIWADEELSLRQKMDATQGLIEELSGRIENPPEYKEGGGLLARIKALVRGQNSEPKVQNFGEDEEENALDDALFLVREAVASDTDAEEELEEGLAAVEAALAVEEGYKHGGHGNQKVHAGKNVAVSALRGEIRQARKKGHTSKAYRLTQEVNKLRGFKEKAKTKTEDGKDFPAGDYAYVPDAEKPSTWKLRLAATPGGGPDAGIVGAAMAAFSPGGFRGNKVEIPEEAMAATKAKIRAAWKKVHPDMDPEKDMPRHMKEISGQDPEGVLTDGVLTAFKDSAGGWRWFLTATNKFKDLEGEIFTDASHKEFLDYLEATKDYPVLRVWHTPGGEADLGQAEWADYTDGFVVYAGRFYPSEEKAAARLAAMGPQGVSQGYYYRRGEKEKGVYNWYRTWELSVLPPARAANQWGAGIHVASKEEAMPFTKEKRDYLLEVFGDEERVSRIESGLATLGKELEGKVAFKDLAEAVADPDPEPKPNGDGEPEPEGGEPEPEPEEPTAVARISKLEEQVGEILARQEELVTATKDLAEGVKVLLKSDEEKISDALKPRRPAPRPSESTANIVEAAKEAAGDEEPPKASPVDFALAQLGINTGEPAE